MRYDLCYDVLVVAVGAQSNTYGVPGVESHAHFLKEVTDARSIRLHILRNFELALQPGALSLLALSLCHLVSVFASSFTALLRFFYSFTSFLLSLFFTFWFSSSFTETLCQGRIVRIVNIVNRSYVSVY